MIQVNERSIFSFVLLVFAIVMLVSSMGMRTDVVLIPRIMGTVLLVFAAYQFLTDLFPSLWKKVTLEAKEEASSDAEENKDTEEEKESMKDTYLFMGWMVLFLLFIYFTSMVVAIVISLLIYLRWMQKESWKLTILYTVIFGLSIYLIFVVGMKIHYFI